MALVTDFVLPQVRPLGYDDEVEVRVAYASCLAGLTETGERFLDLSESFRSLGGRDDGIGAGDVEEVSPSLIDLANLCSMRDLTRALTLPTTRFRTTKPGTNFRHCSRWS